MNSIYEIAVSFSFFYIKIFIVMYKSSVAGPILPIVNVTIATEILQTLNKLVHHADSSQSAVIHRSPQ